MRRVQSSLGKEFKEFSYEETLQILHSKYPHSKYDRSVVVM